MNWNFWRDSPPVKYHGLLNQGATCYLNSVLQVLFMTEDFRAAVERDTSENPDHDCIDRHLSTLFADLKERTAYTYKITQKLGIIRVHEQQDAAEYFEKILRLTRSGASQIFCGQLTHKTICTTCYTEAEADATFWYLPLALVDSNSDYSVVDGIEDYFRSSEFSGDNQMYCDKCDDKSDATIKCVIKRHPEVLMLLLKRFEFNYSNMTYVKINQTVVVPFTLQIPENRTYELYAVVDHFGDLRGGHYTATIKDDEGWYKFDDTRVTLNDYPPFQKDNFEKSSSAYLLFYRKMNVPAADTQDNREVSTPEVILPATTPIYDQCQDGKMRMSEEAEEAEEEGNVTMVTEMKDIVGSREVRLPPDLCDTEENQDTKSYNRYEGNEETNYYQDAHAKKQRDEEDVGENAQANKQTKKRETELVESVEVQDSDSGKQRTPEAEVRHEVHDRKQDEMSDTKRRVTDVKTEIGGKTEDDEQPERKGKSLTKYPDRDVEYQDNEDNAREDLEVGQDDDVKPVSVQMEGKTGEGERSSEGEKLFEFQDNRREGDSEENMPEDDQTCKQGSSTMYNIHEQQREDKMYVKEHKDGDDKHGQDVEDQNNEDNIRQKQPEQKISVVGEKRQTEEKGITGDELIRDKADSSLRRAGSAGSRRLTENQRVRDDEETRQHAPPQVRPAYNEDGDIDKRRGSKKSKVCYGKIIEEEIKETRSGTQISIVTDHIQIKTVEESSQESTLSKEFDNLNLTKSSMPNKRKRLFGKAQEGNETISTTHSNYGKKTKVSDTKEQAAGMEDTKIKRGSHEKKERKWWPHKKEKKDVHEKKQRKWWPHKKEKKDAHEKKQRKWWPHKKEKKDVHGKKQRKLLQDKKGKKKKKSTGCSFLKRRQKQEDNTSESD